MTKEIEKMKVPDLKAPFVKKKKMMLFCIVFNFGLFLLNFIEINKIEFFLWNQVPIQCIGIYLNPDNYIKKN